MPETTTNTTTSREANEIISNMEGRIDEQLIVNYTRPMRKLKSLKAVIIHWTANKSRGADAQANRNYFNNLRPQHLPDGRVRKVYASAHYMVDD
ncbi:MAG: N-acetylmuramoyl-L-alanine amidase, partial [Bacteroidia bacterium]